jgi:hypothetical protein
MENRYAGGRKEYCLLKVFKEFLGMNILNL